MYRGAVEDMARWTRMYGYPQCYDRDWVRKALLFGNSRPKFRYFGFISPRNLSPSNPYMRRVGLELASKSQRLREARKLYCEHGKEMVIQWGEGRKTLRELIDQGETVIVRRWRSFVFEGG